MIKNAIAYITRKRNRTLIIFIILTIVLSCLYSCLTIMKSSNEIEKTLYESSNSSISITKKDGKYFNVNQFKDIEKLKEVEEIRKVIALGLMLRNEKQLKVRQPLNTMYISSEKDIEKSIRDFEPIIKEELNVKTIDLIKDESILNDEYLMVNFKVAGRMLKEKIQDFKAKIEGLSDEEMKKLVSKFNDEKISEIEVPGFGTFEKDVFLKNMRPKAHIVVIKEGDYTIALDTILTEELIVEGMYRDLVRTLQVLRKDAGLKVEQRITLSLQTEGKLMQKVLEEYLEKITQDTLTEKFVKTPIENDIEKEIEINGEKVTVQIKGM